MKTHVTLSNPVLVFVYSLSLLLLGGAIGIKWHSEPVAVFSIALLGAALMVVHDTFSALLWLWVGARYLGSATDRKDRD
jgi:hypothetical protein